MKNKKYMLAAILLLVLGFMVYRQVNKPSRTAATESAEMVLTAPQLYAKYVKNEALANQHYLDKTVEVRGMLQNMSRGNDRSLVLTLEAFSSLGGVTCEVPGANIPEGLNLKMGEEITVQGMCTGFMRDVALVNCKIVR